MKLHPAFLLLCAAAAAALPAVQSPDGAYRWTEGESFLVRVTVRGEKRKEERIRLPPLAEPEARRRLLFAERGDYFCVLDEKVDEIGLHLDRPRGAAQAKALVLAPTLRLLDRGGRTLWTRRMDDKHMVGAGAGALSPRLTSQGALAVLLQDADPYSKGKPLLLVLDRAGQELRRLDYTSWSRVDEFALSEDGGVLAVRGLGRIPDKESWGLAFGYYGAEDAPPRIRALKGPVGEDLRSVDKDGWACCVRQGSQSTAFGPSGETRPEGSSI